MKNNKKFDYYTVQVQVDGFGNDTYVVFSSRDYHKCEEHAKNDKWLKDKDYVIVGQQFNKKFYNEY